MPCTRAMLASALLLVGSGIARAGAPPLPYRLAVQVEWGDPLGPESFRLTLERQLITELADAGCFEWVGGTDGEREPDLRLRLRVRGYEEEQEFEYALAERANPGNDVAQRTVARVEGQFDLEVLLAEPTAVVRSRSFLHRASWRPSWHENPRDEAQRQLIDKAVSTVRKFVCRGKAAKWSQEIERARKTASAPPQR